ncbi:hypothetical protein [Kribbella sp. NPDC048915]|uniref:hypothetical protein n=1 Tax=Kribbella sp. NPDC048915 TaxID=3155148 RepID=UPI0033CF64AC
MITVAPPPALNVRRPRVSLYTLRVVLVLHAVLVIAQPIAAGYFLAGNVDAMTTFHATIGSTIWMVAMLQTGAAIGYAIGSRGRFLPLLWSVVLVVAEFVQLTFGYLQNFAVHVPLGTAIVGSVCCLTVWSFRSTARLNRQEMKR